MKISIEVNSHKSYNFMSSNVYVVEVESKEEGQELSNLITGLNKEKNCVIKIDDNTVSSKELRNISCYVGKGIYKKFFHKRTVRKEIEYALKHSNSNFTSYDIVNMFSLTPSRLERKLKYTGNEHWRASLAIGYAGNKQVFCFPFVNKELASELIRLRIDEFIEMLKSEGKIIVIPTENKNTQPFIISACL